MEKTSGNTGRHSYLIMCHNNFEQMCLLLELLDDDRNDIFIHVDKRVKNVPYDRLKAAVKRSGLYFSRRVKVVWGGSSLIRAELALLEAAAGGDYAYCHFLSGMDLPIKSQDYIHGFFSRLEGRECISFEKIENVLDRVRYFYFFQNIIGRSSVFAARLLRRLEGFSLRVQHRFGLSRIKGRESMFHEGANWVSITGKFAKYVLENRKFIMRNFCFAFCADELFIQTLVMNSPFKDNVYTDSVRLIDWQRGRPYVFTEDDYEELVSSGKLFARKFDSTRDARIVKRIYNFVKTAE